jgi:hypothetical protein
VFTRADVTGRCFTAVTSNPAGGGSTSLSIRPAAAATRAAGRPRYACSTSPYPLSRHPVLGSRLAARPLRIRTFASPSRPSSVAGRGFETRSPALCVLPSAYEPVRRFERVFQYLKFRTMDKVIPSVTHRRQNPVDSEGAIC